MDPRQLAETALRFALAPLRFVGDRVAMRQAGPLDDLAPGSGAIVDLDGQKVAAYRDEDGVVHAVSPICTHIRCVVAFDQGTREWHCPCHDSHFAIDGSVLKGPARKPLQRIEV